MFKLYYISVYENYLTKARVIIILIDDNKFDDSVLLITNNYQKKPKSVYNRWNILPKARYPKDTDLPRGKGMIILQFILKKTICR